MSTAGMNPGSGHRPCVAPLGTCGMGQVPSGDVGDCPGHEAREVVAPELVEVDAVGVQPERNLASDPRPFHRHHVVVGVCVVANRRVVWRVRLLSRNGGALVGRDLARVCEPDHAADTLGACLANDDRHGARMRRRPFVVPGHDHGDVEVAVRKRPDRRQCGLLPGAVPGRCTQRRPASTTRCKNRWVRSRFGASKTCSGGPSSRIRP